MDVKRKTEVNERLFFAHKYKSIPIQTKMVFKRNWVRIFRCSSDIHPDFCKSFVKLCVDEIAPHRWSEQVYEAEVVTYVDDVRPKKTQVYAILCTMVDTMGKPYSHKFRDVQRVGLSAEQVRSTYLDI